VAGILPALGVNAKLLTNRGTECPVCGGKDRFRFDDKGGNGTWFCNQSHGGASVNASGSAGNGFALIMDLKSCDFPEAARLVERIIGTYSAPKTAPAPKEEVDAAAEHAEVVKLWRGGVPVAPDNPAGMYVARRLGKPVMSRALRFHATIPYGETTRKGMLSAYVDQNGELAGMQRTFLTDDGNKASMRNPRLTIGKLPDGGAVRLMRLEPRHSVLGIAEGVETALAASELFGVPCWAALNSGRLAVWEPPEGFKDIIIFGDNDANKAGQMAAYTLANRLEIDRKIITQVEIPPDVGTDWNDVLMQRKGLK
jgi:putative DNA primase/helicase